MSHRRGGPGSSVHYAAAKGAVVTMTMGVAREFATQGIRALSISPGPIRTPFQAAASSSPELVQRFLDDVPMKRFGEGDSMNEAATKQPPFAEFLGLKITHGRLLCVGHQLGHRDRRQLVLEHGK